MWAWVVAPLQWVTAVLMLLLVLMTLVKHPPLVLVLGLGVAMLLQLD